MVCSNGNDISIVNTYPDGCFDMIVNYLKKHSAILGTSAILVAVLMVFTLLIYYVNKCILFIN